MALHIESAQNGGFRIIGELTFNSVSGVDEKGMVLFDMTEGEDLCIDLQEVSHTDSAGLVLLIGWIRYASKKNKTLQFLNAPNQMLALAKSYNLDRIFRLC